MRHGEGAGSLDKYPDIDRRLATNESKYLVTTYYVGHIDPFELGDLSSQTRRSRESRRAQRLHILLSDDPAGPQLGNAPPTHHLHRVLWS